MWVPTFSISSFPRWPEICFGCSQALPSWQGWASLLPSFPHIPADFRKCKLFLQNGGFLCVMSLSSCVLEGKDPPVGFFQEQLGNLEKGIETKKIEYHCLKIQVLEKKWGYRWMWPCPSPTGSTGSFLLGDGCSGVGWHCTRHRSD